MPVSFIPPSASWFAKAPKDDDTPTPEAGAIHFDGLNGPNSFTILGSNLATPVGHGFMTGDRIYTHFGFPQTPNAGEWLFYRVSLTDKRMIVHSPILEGDKLILPCSGEFRERPIEGVRIQYHGDAYNTVSFLYTLPSGEEVELMKTAPKNWLSENAKPVLVNVSTYEDFLMVSYSPRAEGEDFPVEDFLYTIVANRHTGRFLGQGLRREYYSMSARFDSYLELGSSPLGPVGEHDWWPVFYYSLWRHTLRDTKQPLWNFDKQAINVIYATGHASQRFVLA